jgi:hypothetical protein
MQDDTQPGRRRPRIVGIANERAALMSDPADTAQGCRERAAADLSNAKGNIPPNARRVLETSARNWLARAELLDRLEKNFAERSSDGAEGDA